MADLKFLDALASTFESLPGVGKKTARRYAYHVIEKMTDEDVEVFAKTLIETKNKVKHCPICGMLSTQEPCEICSSKLRDRSKIMGRDQRSENLHRGGSQIRNEQSLPRNAYSQQGEDDGRAFLLPECSPFRGIGNRGLSLRNV